MAPHSSTLAWKIPWTEEPGRLQCMGSLRVGHDWATSLSLFTFVHWRRKWQPTPVFLPGEPQGRGSLVGCSAWGRTESDTTEATSQQQQQQGHVIALNTRTCTLIFLSPAFSLLFPYIGRNVCYCKIILKYREILKAINSLLKDNCLIFWESLSIYFLHTKKYF